MRLYAATGDAIARIDDAVGVWTAELSLRGSGAQCLAVDPADPDCVYAGLRSGGVHKSRDGGQTWIDCGLPEPEVFSLAVSAANGAVYAGCEPSALFRSDDGGRTWRALAGLLDLPSRSSWSFPPRPWTSHVRWIAPSPHDSDLLLVGIELGGLMRSSDGGETWADHRPGAQRDVHSLTWHPRVPGRAYEAGGGGTAWSDDGGETFHPADEGRRAQARTLRIDEATRRRAFFAGEAGRPGTCSAAALPEPLLAMPYALVATDERFVAGLADGQVWQSRDRGQTWEPLDLGGDPLPALMALSFAA